jgi:outer membrane protein assembly factor BamB
MTDSRWSWIVSVLFVGVTAVFAQSVSADDWPGWRGPDRTDVSKETGLLKKWPAEGPKRVWLNENAGLGYSGVSVVDGRLFTLGARDDAEQLICLDAATGEEKWATQLGPILGNKWGDGPRGTPTVDGTHVYAMGGTGHLICVQAEDGKKLWTVEMSELGGGKPNWGYCESVLVDGPRVVCTPGGSKGAIAALNKETGEVLWRSTELTNGAQYASIIPAVIHDQAQYVQLFQNELAAVSPEDGKLLWKTSWPGKTAVIPTPIVSADHVFVTSGYGVGCMLVKIDADNKLEEVYFNKNMKNHHGGVLLLGEHLYGHSDGVGWTCLDFKTGEIVWNERGALGKGCVTSADGMLYCVDEGNGEVALVEASPNGWNEQGRFKLTPQTTQRSPSGRIWTHPVVSNGKLYLRDQDLLFCYDVKAE